MRAAFKSQEGEGWWSAHTSLLEAPLVRAQSLQTEHTALPLQRCKRGASTQFPGVLLGQPLVKALPPPLLSGEVLLAHSSVCWLAEQGLNNQRQESDESRPAENII